MTRIKLLTVLAFVCLFIFSCKDDLDPTSKYNRPEWLAGKVYTQVKETPELSIFARCLELTGYDTIIDVSGSYTVFAPNDEAFTRYLQSKSDYNSVEDIPAEELSSLVKYHIVQNPWSKQQLMSLDVYGWIDSTDRNNDKPRGFKRETLLLEDDRRYGIDYVEGRENFIIVDSTESNWLRRVATDSRKYIPVFFRDYLNIYDLSSSDYEFYFDRPLEGSNDIYFAGAKVIGNEIFAENGFVYNIDRVVEPLLNAYQILGKKEGDYQYTRYQEVLNLFSEFEYNEQKTFDQPGADQG
ncbi:MAG: fasciclin domain-containing protein, partial [Bacteroidales bacterium]